MPGPRNRPPNRLCRLWALGAVLFAADIAPADGQMIEVALKLAAPELADERTVHVEGTTNLPPGTRLNVKAELTGRPAKKTWAPTGPQPDDVPAGAATVAEDGTFVVTLRDFNNFKTGDYRITVEMLAYEKSLGLFYKPRPVRPQPDVFYQKTGRLGETLRGPLVDRSLFGFAGDPPGRVSVTVTERHALRADPEVVEKEEKATLRLHSKSLERAHAELVRLWQAGVYGPPEAHPPGWYQARQNYDRRLKLTYEKLRTAQTQQAYCLLMDAYEAYYELYNHTRLGRGPGTPAYQEAVAEYVAVKAKYDAFVQ